jgi:hypothetical protein
MKRRGLFFLTMKKGHLVSSGTEKAYDLIERAKGPGMM